MYYPKHHIALVGMPCVGKTTAGKLLAERLGCDFVDLDHMMSDNTGKSVAELLAELGEERFLELETQALQEATEPDEPRVIATGGSVVLSPDACEILKDKTKPAWLEAPIETIAERVEGSGRGPLIVGLDGGDGVTDAGTDAGDSAESLLDRLNEIYEVRKPLYQKVAYHYIDTDLTSDIDEVVRILVDMYG